MRGASKGHMTIREFHEAMDQHRQSELALPPPERVDLRKKLIKEETKEFFDAVTEGDLLHACKEMADLLYVVYGTCVEFGIPDEILVDVVHRNNMTKLWEDGKPRYFPNGKVKKPPTYEEVSDDEIVAALRYSDFL